ncbi:MAG TPA: choice-of-anchor D domain-containing protein, partial [Candidatus Eisenbacteria bacterium]|nr:choice-of-anchor D domain-containing protein [Candidatus Eisenbacteria bacterium]
VFDLTPFAGQILQIRFRAGWDCGNCGANEGWYLDDVSVYSTMPRIVSASPVAGTIPPGGAVGLSLGFDATGLFGGDYSNDVLVRSNDPDENPAVLATTLHVTGAPDVAWDPPAVEFGARFIGGAATDTVAVFNAGTDVLHVTEVTLDRPEYQVETAPFTLNPGARHDLHVTFRPVATGVVTASLILRSDDPDEPDAAVPIRGEGVVPPSAGLAPASIAATVETGQTATRTLTLRNDGGSDLVFQAYSDDPAPAPPADSSVAIPDSLRGPTANTLAPTPGEPQVQAVYAGTYLRFGVTSFGEIMPYQYPLGNEHLQVGNYTSGYTLAYESGGTDHVGFAFVSNHYGLAPEQYREIENSPSRVVVEVSLRTADGLLRIVRTITFERTARAVRVETRLENVAGTPLGAVVFKEAADWDVDQNFYDDWDYDRGRHLVYAKSIHVAGLASADAPDQMDIFGWNDLMSRSTFVDFPTGPVFAYDGVALLHFELGPMVPSGARTITVAYGAGDDLNQLRAALSDALRGLTWLSVTPSAGTVPAGGSIDLTARFEPGRRSSGDYDGRVVVDSNDPAHPRLEASAVMTVIGRPLFTAVPAALAFDSIFVGATLRDSLRVRNGGVDPLLVSGVTSPDPSYAASPSAFAVAPGDSQLVVVTFHPLVAGDRTSTLQFIHNAAGSPSSVAVSGFGLVPPDIAADPASFTVDTETGRVETRTLTVRNGGGSELVFQASTLGLSEAALPGTPVSLPDSLQGRATPNTTAPSAP